jgi:NADH-ubiquinone oxidoreductase chain 4
LVAALGATGILLSACYSLFLYNRLSYGDYSPYLNSVKDLNRREFHLLLTLIIPTYFFGIFPNIILNGLHSVIITLIYSH